MEKIKIKFFKDGKIELETSGFKGEACMKATEAIEKALGKITAIEHSPEFYEQEVQEVQEVTNG